MKRSTSSWIKFVWMSLDRPTRSICLLQTDKTSDDRLRIHTSNTRVTHIHTSNIRRHTSIIRVTYGYIRMSFSFRNFEKCNLSKPLKYSFITVFNSFLKCNFMSFAHMQQESTVVRLFVFRRDWLMPSWIAKKTFMITFNTCRSWWGGCQVNMVCDRAPKPMYKLLKVLSHLIRVMFPQLFTHNSI